MAPKKRRKMKKAWNTDPWTNGSAGQPRRLTLHRIAENKAVRRPRLAVNAE